MIFCCCQKNPCTACADRCYPNYSDYPLEPDEPYEYKYDYLLIICNANAAKDDEWRLSLNGNDWGNVSELGINKCQGKLFYTSEEFLDYFLESVRDDGANNSGATSFCGVPRCCIQGTIDIKAFQQVNSGDFKECENNILKMTVTKQNFNGNFGYIMIFRGKYRLIDDGSKKFVNLCLLTTSTYSQTPARVGGSVDITVIYAAQHKCKTETIRGPCRPIGSQ